jgi:hypothetical protein
MPSARAQASAASRQVKRRTMSSLERDDSSSIAFSLYPILGA